MHAYANPKGFGVPCRGLRKTKRQERGTAVATYHLSVKTTSRADGLNAVARASYRAGEALTNEMTGEVFDYKKKSGIVHTELIFPESWQRMEREELWNHAEKSETRKNSTVCREFEIALPVELTHEQRVELTQNFTKSLTERFGFAADVAIHNPPPEARKPGADREHGNPHAHILTTTRDAAGKKCRELDDMKSGAVAEVRELWAEHCNRALEKAGVAAKVSHLSGTREERKTLNEKSLAKVDRQIRALENAIARLERRTNDLDSGNSDNSPRIKTQGTEQLLSGREPENDQSKNGSLDAPSKQRPFHAPPLPYRRYGEDAEGDRSNIRPGGRDDHGKRRAEPGLAGACPESPRLGGDLREPFNEGFSTSIEKLRVKLEALKAQRNLEAIGVQDHDRTTTGAVNASVEAHEARAAAKAERTARAKERIAESRSPAHSQSRGPSGPQNQSGPTGGPRFGM